MVIMSKLKSIDKQIIGENGETTDAEDPEDIPPQYFIIAQEVKIVKALASNDLSKRNKQMKRLRKWLEIRAHSSFPLEEEDFRRIWKGLYYNMWFSDKPLAQEEQAEKMGKLFACFEGDMKLCAAYFSAFLSTMSQEWFGIDQWRLDKFMMLVRRMLRYMFSCLKDFEWRKENIDIFNEHIAKTVLDNSCPSGLTMHFMDIFFEELAKVAANDISAEAVGDFMRPFIKYIATQRCDFKLVVHCRRSIFYHMLYQSSLGRDYSEKYNAWKEMGFPTSSIDDLEKDEDAEGIEETLELPKNVQKHLDPRAGNVDVFMPELPLDGKYVIEELEKILYKQDCSTKVRKLLNRLLETFQTYQNGIFPLGVRTMPRFEMKFDKPLVEEKLDELENLEKELYGTGRLLKQMPKRKRKKLLNSLDFDSIDEDNIDEIIEKAIPMEYQNKHFKKFQTASGWIVEESVVDQSPTEAKREQTTNINKKKKVLKSLEDEIAPVAAKKIKKSKSATEIKAKKGSNAATAENANKNVTPTVNMKSEWDEPLADGEIEYFIPSNKLLSANVNTDSGLVPNPLSRKFVNYSPKPKKKQLNSPARMSTHISSKEGKRVKIALQRNTVQKPSEYIRQLRKKPDVPYDAQKQPSKGLLKPNFQPSPINPFYKFEN